MSLVRVQRTAQIQLTHRFEVDELLTDAGGAVSVETRRLDGTLVDSAVAGHLGQGVYSYTPPAQAQLDCLPVDWSGSFGGVTVVARDYVEIVGGFYFGIGEARSAHAGLKDANKYPLALLQEKRTTVECEADLISGRAFVPRFRRVQLDGTGGCDLATPDLDLRVLRAATIWGTAMTAGQLGQVKALSSGVLSWWGGYWPVGRGNIIVEYEYGADFVPPTVHDMAILRMRSVVATTQSAIPDRATSYTVVDGGVYRLSTPGAYSTGIPDVDAAYLRQSYDGPV